MNDNQVSSLDQFQNKDKDFNFIVGTVIKHFRKFDNSGKKRSNAITQEELANNIELSRMSIVNFENGKTHVPIIKLFLICIYLKVPIKKFMIQLEKELSKNELYHFTTPKDSSTEAFEELLNTDKNLAQKLQNEWE